MTNNGAYRCIDANINRAVEGLRVLEDIARFYFDNAAISAQCKNLRHGLRQIASTACIANRDTPGDVGTQIQAADENKRSNLVAVVVANAKRVQEALRVIEEQQKLLGLAVSAEQCRYLSYGIEKELLQLIPAQSLQQERLYVLIDHDTIADPIILAAQLAQSDVRLIQYRAKSLSINAYYERAQQIQKTLRADQLFIVNDHIEVAAALRADGVHLGQDDVSPAIARKALGPLALIGLSTHTVEQVQQAHQEPIDYIGIGPMFATATKAHEPVRGPELLQAAASAITLPSYAIGGLTNERIAELRSYLPHGVAVSSMVGQAPAPIAAVAALNELLTNA